MNKNNSKIMKKIILTIASLALGAAVMSAQDLKAVSELFNSGAESLNNGAKTEALASFQNALSQATALGDEGKEVVDNCKNIIPNLMISIAKDLFKEDKIDDAIAKAAEALAFAKEFNIAEGIEDATNVIGQFRFQKGNDALNAKDFAGAVEAYRSVLDGDPANGAAALRLGMALAGSGDTAAAEEAYKTAAANGQEAAANKQLGNLALKAAAAALKTKDFQGALENALKSAEFNPSANAFKIAGNAAAQLKKYKEAVEYFGKYLSINPNAADAAQIKTTVEALKKLAQ